jgi:uncharacterized protein
MQTGIYIGRLRHRRFQPVLHEFSYPIFMVLLDVDRIPSLMHVSPVAAYNRFAWASFWERDHFGDPSLPLRERLRIDAAAEGIELPEGPIYLLTHLRYLGYTFNPVSFFYCCDSQGRIELILAEVSSTFGESRNYWLNRSNRLESQNSLRYRVPKKLHVSPFMKMQLDYTFVFTPPGENLIAHMNTLDGGTAFFDATLELSRRPWTARSLHSALAQHPFVTLKVIAAIHWEALKLYFKRVPVFVKPKTASPPVLAKHSEGEPSHASVARS